MYRIFNHIEDKVIFTGNERKFIDKMNNILIENKTENVSILGVWDALEYLENCEDLELMSDDDFNHNQHQKYC